jgi:hypothetical protein
MAPQIIMAKPTITQLFGTGAAVVSDPLDLTGVTAANPALVIPFSALSAGNLDVLSSMQDPEKVITALMSMFTAWYLGDSTEDPLIEAAAVREATQSRRNQRMRSYAFELTVFKPLPASPTIDPDTLDVV